MPDSKPGYNLHPRYNRPILRRQRRNDGRRENTHGKTKRRTAGRKTRPERQAGRQRRPARNAQPRQIAQNAPQQQIGRRSEDQPRQTGIAASHARNAHSGQAAPVAVSTARPDPPAPAQTVSRSRCSQGRGRPDSSARTHPAPRPQSWSSKCATGQSVFPDQPQPEIPAFSKTKKRKSSFCAFLCEKFQKNFFCLFLRLFPAKCSQTGPFMRRTDTKSTGQPP